MPAPERLCRARPPLRALNADGDHADPAWSCRSRALAVIVTERPTNLMPLIMCSPRIGARCVRLTSGRPYTKSGLSPKAAGATMAFDAQDRGRRAWLCASTRTADTLIADLVGHDRHRPPFSSSFLRLPRRGGCPSAPNEPDGHRHRTGLSSSLCRSPALALQAPMISLQREEHHCDSRLTLLPSVGP